jgi:hypothetical protein
MLSEDENTYANDEWSRLLPDIRHNATVDLDAVFVEYIAFVLGDDYVASMLEGKQMGESGLWQMQG